MWVTVSVLERTLGRGMAQKRAATNANPAQLDHPSSEVLPRTYKDANNYLQTELGENQEQGRVGGRRMGEMRVGVKGREFTDSFNTAGLGEAWFQTGRPGSRDLPGGFSQEALPALLGPRDEKSLVNEEGEAGTQAMHGIGPVCSLQLWPVSKIISLR